MTDGKTSRSTIGAGMVALGIVYGDIGTSPLYAMKTALEPLTSPGQLEVLGILSLIIWAMTAVISVKYVSFVLKADNGGEGGLLALSGLLDKWSNNHPEWKKWIAILAVAGCSLLLGDGMLTPSISVLSAVEGLKVVAPSMESWIVPVTLIILIVLFMVQKGGTHRIARVFGPVMLLWFCFIGVTGLMAACSEPVVFLAFSPYYAGSFIFSHSDVATGVFGAVFLVLTGGEALYADIGHCGGRIPVRNAWFSVVMPSLMLCYLGQGAAVLHSQDAIAAPFYAAIPSFLLIPAIILATVATIIASQALISGVFTMARQSMQLGICPRMKIRQTHNGEIGQIYVPAANRILMVGCCALVLRFGSSDALAHAYGIAVSITMLITTLLTCLVMMHVWNYKPLFVGLFALFFLSLEGCFSIANAAKLFDGGWVTPLVAVIAFYLSAVWMHGARAVREGLAARSLPASCLNDLFVQNLVRTPGVEVFLTKTTDGLPPIMSEYARKTRSLAERVVIMHFDTARVPYLRRKGNITVTNLGGEVWRVSAAYGFMQIPRVMALLEEAEILGLPFSTDEALIVVGVENPYREKAEKGGRKSTMSPLAFTIYRLMTMTSSKATTSFKLPYNRVLEVGLYIKV